MDQKSDQPRVVVACDKFKGSLSGEQIVRAVSQGIHKQSPGAAVTAVPVADGGEGTLLAFQSAGFTHVPMNVEGPHGQMIYSGYAIKDSETVIEMADACGLQHADDNALDPLHASSYGLGQVIYAALSTPNVKHIILGIGGSASTDGGAGMLQALGARITTATGHEVPRGGGPLAEATAIDLNGLHPRLQDVKITIASDVQNPLLGSNGAAHVYGPQKGATPSQCDQLDGALRHFVNVVQDSNPAVNAQAFADAAGAGAAGGVGFAALAFLNATMASGIDLILDRVGFNDLISDTSSADLVITGEGHLDTQTLAGKAPVGVAQRARQHNIRTVAVCGRCSLSEADLQSHGINTAYALTDLETDVDKCMDPDHATTLLEKLAERAAMEHLAQPAATRV